ncbi:MAG: hypothetical protein M3R36_11560 [Bacteroidota bacterium]|nr:hypothetical protein [Bacteroidota bacterium]
MSGISYITDEKGKKNAVVLDLKKYSKIWEDIYDIILSDERAKEPKESYESVKERLKKRSSK